MVVIFHLCLLKNLHIELMGSGWQRIAGEDFMSRFVYIGCVGVDAPEFSASVSGGVDMEHPATDVSVVGQ